MTTKTKKPAGKKTAKSVKKATKSAAANAAIKKSDVPTVDATPIPDPCADGHKWDKDGDTFL